MKIASLLLLLCFVCFAASQTTNKNIEISITNLLDGEVQTPNPPTWAAPSTSTGYVTVQVTAPYPVDVCFQEGTNGAQGTDLAVSCNKEGFILGNTTGTTDGSGSASASDDAEFDGASTGGAKRLLRRFFMEDTVAASANLYLRQSTYTISVTWSNQPDTPDNATAQSGNVNLNLFWTECDAGAGVGPGCAFTPVVAQADTNVTVTTAAGGDGVLYKFKNEPNELGFLTSLAFVISPSTAALVDGNSTIQAYVRRDAPPFIESNHFDAGSNSSSTSNDLIGFTNPESGDYYLLIITTDALTLTLDIQTSQSCNTTQGSFPSGAGGCVQAIPVVANGTNVTDTSSLVANGTTITYNSAPITYFLWNTSALLVGVVNSDHSDDDAPQIFASTVGIPSSNGSEFSAVATDTQVNFLNVEAADDTTVSNWIISVEATQDFEIWVGAGCANDCSGNGQCSAVTSGSNGLCACDEHYKDFECGTKTLKTIYIVLIAIGGAIVLAIAIGVPVGCYIKNRKRARYERV